MITLAVRWYLRYGLLCRDVEELLAEHGIEVHHVRVFRWVHRLASLLIAAARPCRHAPDDQWFIDETYGRSAADGSLCTGRWTSLADLQVIDVLVFEKRELAAAR